MTDKYQDLRDGMPELQREAARKGGYNPRAQLIIDLLAERDALQAENERLRQDAERYRRLRIGGIDDIAVVRGLGAMDYGMSAVVGTYSEEIDDDDLDAAIDEAMAKEVSND